MVGLVGVVAWTVVVDGPDVPADVPVEGVLAAVVADADEEVDRAGLVAVVTLPTDVDGLADAPRPRATASPTAGLAVGSLVTAVVVSTPDCGRDDFAAAVRHPAFAKIC